MSNYKIEDLLIHPALLEANGYKKFNDTFSRDKQSYVGSWQKTVRNDHGKAYFINFNFSDNSYYYNLSPQHLIDVNPFNWEADLQLYTFNREMTIDMKILFAEKRTLEDVESFCEKMFRKMQLDNYEYYDEDARANREKEIERENIVENAVLLELDLKQKDGKVSKIKKMKV